MRRERKVGWVNIDLLGDPVDVAWNLAHSLPFDSGSVVAIFHEHLLEHLPLQAGDSFMQECFRVLRPGGILRVGVPDAGRLIQSYAGDRSYLENLHPSRPTALIAVQELFYWHRHCAMFDVETLELLFRASGFPTRTNARSGIPILTRRPTPNAGAPTRSMRRPASLTKWLPP